MRMLFSAVPNDSVACWGFRQREIMMPTTFVVGKWPRNTFNLLTMARNFGHFRTETSCGLHEGFIYTAGIHGKVRADPTN